ncbi:bifunctional 5,10-methylenetetrahydrofolate dehydrogenase/5,10-methenyltetrahydrofolate cyclohydrolase [Mycoplasma sp. M5725]|uniref:Bifunctional protein FolD n=1 Tax=Mycoplasma phocimorsus TaxID=3045839 RepID=A0AAJ1UX21_9MOLU|nr:bifunctional 5,10-methylenetetrahydrofolate dehydrogenase/5,10-methenyltetrahydrofolate cyclohydrolase [Mycoplasma phocimorsus]MDJ1646065.1 bifunctional 5,10-methylenetetrahydrofolate dehydrogenase/5,10-methenyltetrahydrofolate cyclohydrolase [Mycoplasma phocimorsus]MDJ1646369.1 bifunctional 5,10-methylenetetrahydrofolate dehydrogenase/5,10-methenyltetrahydrofolate cyclohydrolase [Mycoplasma phocimorsus]MDJ1647955.1 bifunctional 5,10-methylenetetrahydrofolate dehydrogenase/5,10-methenyltetrah
MQLMNGKEISQKLTEILKDEINKLTKKPTLAIVQIGDNFASNKYIQFKMNKATELGVNKKLFKFSETISFKEIKKEMEYINEHYDGIIIQLPVPSHLDKRKVCDLIEIDKDVDGLTTKNLEKLYSNQKTFIPATVKSVLTLLDVYEIEVEGKTVGVVGQSDLVGKPLSTLLARRGAILSRYDKETGISGLENNDIVIVATGVAKLVKKENLKKGSIVIDVGINQDQDNLGKPIGDVDPDGLDRWVSLMSPVPGGVGPLTVFSLFDNLIETKRK